jgi:hypothetical protein
MCRRANSPIISAGIVRLIKPQERAQDPAATPGQGHRRRGADTVIGARHNRRMTSHHHLRLPT